MPKLLTMVFMILFLFSYIDYFLSKDLCCKCAHIFHKLAHYQPMVGTHWEIGKGFSNWGHFNLQSSKKLDKLENRHISSLEIINIMWWEGSTTSC
jgi:hypothetical protein